MKQINSSLATEITGKTCIVKFGAEWCAPCRAIAPTLEQISKDLSVEVLSVDIDENLEDAAAYNVRAVPTLILFKDGQPKQVLVGNKSYEDIATAYENMVK